MKILHEKKNSIKPFFSEKIEPGPPAVGKNQTFFLTLKLISKISTGTALLVKELKRNNRMIKIYILTKRKRVMTMTVKKQL